MKLISDYRYELRKGNTVEQNVEESRKYSDYCRNGHIGLQAIKSFYRKPYERSNKA